MPLPELAAICGQDADRLPALQHGRQQRGLQQRRRKNRNVHRCGQLALEHGQKAAACRDRGHALGLQLARRIEKGPEQAAVALQHHAAGARAGHDLFDDRERKAFLVAHVPRDAGKMGVQHQNTECFHHKYRNTMPITAIQMHMGME